MNRKTRPILLLLGALLISFYGATAAAQQAQTIALHDIPDNPEMRIITIELAPGQASAPHRHNAWVFVYVLEGVVEMQARGGELVRLHAGDTFYETPADIHQVSRNASSTEPATFIVHMLREADTPVTIPVE